VRGQFPELAVTTYLINGVLEGRLRLEKVSGTFFVQQI